MRSLVERIHGGSVHPRRIRCLADALTPLISSGSRVLDVGCGDGMLAGAIAERRDDISIRGADVLVREGGGILVDPLDGDRLPYAQDAFDTVMLVDVIHHAEDPLMLLAEATRVSSDVIIIKDHLLEGIFASATLRFMDWVGNARHGVNLPYSYWTGAQWDAALDELKLTPMAWQSELGLYPVWARPLVERDLHFIAKLCVPDRHGSVEVA